MNKIRPPPAAELGGWVTTTWRSGECGETLGALSFKLEMKLMGKKKRKKKHTKQHEHPPPVDH